MNLFETEYVYYILRIIIAGICGCLIGFERKVRSKGAGVRTHCVVACAAALMIIISKYAFYDVVLDGFAMGADIRLDPSRVASTIVSGVGFLGAGTIFVHKNKISGLTTAAGIWATSGVGMAIGAGMYLVGIAATIIIVLSQVLLHMNFKFLQEDRTMKLKIYNVKEEHFQALARDLLKTHGISIHDTAIKKEDSTTRTYSFIIDVPKTIDEDEILSLFTYNCEISSNI